METLAWTLYFVTRKYSDCMQNYTMLLEQCEHIVVKDLATAIGGGPNSCLLGHVTGQLFCLYVKIFLPSIFNSVDF